MHSNLAKKIRTLIDEKNLSVQGLEKKAGLSINSIRNILTGHSKKPSAEHLLAISRVLGCSIGELLDEEISNRSQSPLFKELTFANLELLEKIFLYIVSFHNERKKPLTNKELYDATEKIYIYLIKNNKGDFDKDFADWYLDSRF
jgi:transcriptional regulator with XRE-family HTH domain